MFKRFTKSNLSNLYNPLYTSLYELNSLLPIIFIISLSYSLVVYILRCRNRSYKYVQTWNGLNYNI